MDRDKFVPFKFAFNHASSQVYGAQSRIAGGFEISDNDFRTFNYQIGMYIKKSDRSVSICGGALVHPLIILTAGHCVYKATQVSIFMGTRIKPYSEYDPNNIIVGAENITIHEDYNDYTLGDDIALIRLPSPVELSATVGIIELASYDWIDCETGIAWVSGWGKMGDSDYSIPDVLNYLQVEPISYKQCHDVYDFLETGKQLCSSGDLYQGICQGDSGGPYAFETVFGKRVLCGLNSFVALSGCINNWPRGYISVAYYNDNGWICRTSNGLVGCSRYHNRPMF
ncbi:brachyurin-like [Condylostylus longicornis]|uniref:brachyurin-like n=1 Tax=Condylostylus longicornis TaxID=2530218 RepID=UPI00244E1FFE|nr:brachyurin-like [Condylostylus longicornis]